MSRIAKYPVAVPEKVEVTVGAADVTVKGPLGTLKQGIAAGVVVKREGDKITFAAADESQQSNALSGTMRNLVANMVAGVNTGLKAPHARRRVMRPGAGQQGEPPARFFASDVHAP
jgi:large subunit ribosomal protein L6